VKRFLVNELIRFSLANYLSGIIASLAGGLIPLLIVNILGPESVAYYYIASTMVALIGRIPDAVTNSLFAEGSQPAADFSRDVRRSAKLIVPLVGAGILAFYFFGNLLLGLFGHEYSDAAFRLMQLLALSTGLGVIPGLYGTKLLVEKRVRRIVALSIVGSVVGLGLIALLLPSRGLTGVGEASLAGNGLMAVLIGILWTAERRTAVKRKK
jgi:O-antigen/teichoic acid export membrane protein